MPVGRDFPHPSRSVVGPTPASYTRTVGTGTFPELKRPGPGVDHPPPSRHKVKERVELYAYSPAGYSRPVLGRTLPLMKIAVGSWSKVCTVFSSSGRRFPFLIQQQLRIYVYAFSVWVETLRRDILQPQGILSSIHKHDSYTRKGEGPGRIELWHSTTKGERKKA
jgi:hypothetical protein